MLVNILRAKMKKLFLILVSTLYCLTASVALSKPYIACKTLGATSAYLASPDSVNHDNEWKDNTAENFTNGNPLHVTHVLYSYPEYMLDQWGSESTGLPGLNEVYHPPANIDKENLIPIILIHGWQGDSGLTDPVELIKYENSAEKYFEDFIEYFESTPDLYTKYRLFLYKYPSYKHITFNARKLKELITQIPYFTDHKPVIIAHSMGGLVSRSLIEEHGYNDALTLITLATPHHGSPAALKVWVDSSKFIPIKDLDTPGSNDLFWDNYDGVFEWAQDDMDILGDGRLSGTGMFDFDNQYRLKVAQEGLFYSNGAHVQNVGSLISNFYHNGIISRFPNPWLTWLNEKWKTNPNSTPYYFYGGFDYDSINGWYGKNKTDYTIFNPLADFVLGKGYFNDAVVPLTSAFLDFTKHDNFITLGDTNQKLFKQIHPENPEYFKCALYTNQLIISDKNIYLTSGEKHNTYIRFFKDYNHDRMKSDVTENKFVSSAVYQSYLTDSPFRNGDESLGTHPLFDTIQYDLKNIHNSVTPEKVTLSPVPAGVNPSQIRFSWSKSSCERCGDIKYDLEIHRNNTVVFSASDYEGDYLDSNSYTLPLSETLDPNATYYWAVFPINELGICNVDVDFVPFTTGNLSANSQPVSTFSVSTSSGNATVTFQVNGSASYDPDSDPIEFAWNWGDAIEFTDWSSSPLDSHLYADTGSYDITLVVRDDNGSESYSSRSVTVTRAPGAPDKAVNPTPSNNRQDIPVDQNISWSNGGGANSYDVYFGVSPTLGGGDFQENQVATSFTPGAMEYNQTYYWRIDSVNAYGTTTGDVWSFSTEQPPAWLGYYYWNFDTDGTEGWTARNAINNGIYDRQYWIIDPEYDSASHSGIISASNLTGVHTDNFDTIEVRAGVKHAFIPQIQAHVMINGSFQTPFTLSYVSGEQTANSQCVYRGQIPYSGQIQQVRIDFFEGTDSVDDRVYVDYVRFNPRPGTNNTISGYVRDSSGAGVSGVNMVLSAGTGSAATDNAGFYRLDVPSGWSGTLNVYKTLYTFTPDYATFTNVTTPATRNFTAQVSDYEGGDGTYTSGDGTISDGYVISHGLDSYVEVQTASTADNVSNPDYTTIISVGQVKAESGEYYIYRASIPFDTSYLPDNCIITGATLYLYGYGADYSYTDFNLEVVKSNQAHNGHLEAEDFDNFGTVSGGVLNTGAWQGNNGVNAVSLNPLGLTWIKKDGITVLGLRSARDISQTEPAQHEFVNIWSSQSGNAFKPRLVISYATDINSLDTGPWPMFGHDTEHTSQSEYSDAGPFLKWRYQTGDDINVSSPAIGSDGTVYVASNDGNLYAILPGGTLDWQYGMPGDNNSSPAIGSDGTVYVGTYAGSLIALSSTGSLEWAYSTGGEIYASPAVGPDGTVYAGSHDDYLYAINYDGSLKWQYQTGGDIHSSPAIGSDSTIYFGSEDHYLYALNSDGTLKWRYETGDIIQSSPAIGQDGVIYIGSSDNFIFAINPDGTLKWQYLTGHDVLSSPAISADGVIYVGSRDGYLYSMNPTGVMRWRYQTGSSIYSSPTVGADGTIIFGSNDFYLYALNPDGSIKWRYSTSGPVVSSASIAEDNTVYFGSWDNYLYALNIPDGKTAIYGVVADISTGTPLASATVSTTGATTQTGTRGEFSLVLNPGVYTLTISKSGYQTTTVSYVVGGAGDAVDIDVNMTTPGLLNIVTTTLADAEADIPYNNRVRISGGTFPYTYSLISGSLPPGLSLDTRYGNVYGIPVTTDSYSFTVRVTDYLGAYADHAYTIEVTGILEFVTDKALPRAIQGELYFKSIEAVGGTQPYTFDIVDGTFPAGVGMSMAGNIGGSEFVERFGPGAIAVDWVFGGNGSPFVTGDDRLQLGDIGNSQNSYAQVTWETNSQSSVRFDWQVSSCSSDHLIFYMDGVLRSSWSGTNSGTYTFSNITAGTHTFKWEYKKDGSSSCGEDTAWIDNVYIDDAPAVPAVSGDYDLRIEVKDDSGRSAEKSFKLYIDEPLVITTPSLKNGITGEAFNQTLAATGGYGAYTWELFSGVLPPGLSLNSASGILAGTPHSAFYGTVIVAVHDEYGRVKYKDFIIEVSDPLEILTTAMPYARVNETYSELIRTNGGIAPFTFSFNDILPDGLSLNTATGIISGTPTVGQTTNFSITVTDSTSPVNQSDTQTLSIEVGSDLTIKSPAVFPDAKYNTAISPRVLVASGGPSPYTWQLIEGYMPEGITLNNGGNLSGTPTDYGDFIFTLRVTDNSGNTAEKEFFWHVSGPLTITVDKAADAAINKPYGFLLTTRGGIRPYTWSIVNGTLPSGLTLHPVTGVIFGTPTSLQSYSFTVRVTDDDDPAQVFEKAFVLNVVGDLMISTDTLPNGRIGETYTTFISANLGVSPYSWSLAGGSLPPGLTLHGSPNLATLDGIPVTAGTYTFTIDVGDSDSPAGTAEKEFTMEIYEDVEIDTNAFPCAARDVPYSNNIAVSGGQAPYTYQVIEGKLPFGLHLNSINGIISGKAEPVGSESSTFTVRAFDSGNPFDYDDKELTIYVVDALTINNTTLVEGMQSQAYEETLTGTGGISPYYVWSVADGDLPEGVNLDSETGVISGTPVECGSFSFTIRIEDSAPIPNNATFEYAWDVTCSNDYFIQGSIEWGQGTLVTLSGDASGTTTVDSNGEFIFEHLTNGSYTIRPSLTGCAFSPTSMIVAVLNMDVTNISFDMYDTDSMNDEWEITYFGSIKRNGSGDYDGDGLTDLQEYQNQTNPTLKDTDGDGMPDKWEIDNDLNPIVNDANGDTDGDGSKNLMEYKRGTDPQDEASHPAKSMPWLPLLLE